MGVKDSKEYVCISYIVDCDKEDGGRCNGEDGAPCCPFGPADGCGEESEDNEGQEESQTCSTGFYEGTDPCEADVSVFEDIRCCSSLDYPDIKGAAGFTCVDGVCTAPGDTAKSCSPEENSDPNVQGGKNLGGNPRTNSPCSEPHETVLGNIFVAHLGECGEFEKEEGGKGKRPHDWRCGPPAEPGDDCPMVGGVYIDGSPVGGTLQLPPTQLSFPHFASWASDPNGSPTSMMFKDERLDLCGEFTGSDQKRTLIPKVRKWESTRAAIAEIINQDVPPQEGGGGAGDGGDGESGFDYDGASPGSADTGSEESEETRTFVEYEVATSVLINPPTRAIPVPGQIVAGLSKWSQEWEKTEKHSQKKWKNDREGIETDERTSSISNSESFDKKLEHQDKAGSIFNAWGGYKVSIPNFYGHRNNDILITPPIEGSKVPPSPY